MRGRTPQPAAVKSARGNPGRRPIGETPAAQALTDDALHLAPEWLSDEATTIWARLAPDLAAMRLLSRPDVMTFGRYCQMFAQWLAAGRQFDETNMVVRTESEHVKMDRVNKWLHVQLMLEQRLRDLEDRFGLNPANRQRIFALRAAGAGAGHTPGLPFGEGGDKPADDPQPAAMTNAQGPIGTLQ
jgi:P27 family predicted phage terminase small subunit